MYIYYSHSVEVLVNVPLVCAKQLLLPADVQIVPTLRQSYPALYREPAHEGEDVNFEDWNMSSISRLLQLLTRALVSCAWGVVIRGWGQLSRGCGYWRCLSGLVYQDTRCKGVLTIPMSLIGHLIFNIINCPECLEEHEQRPSRHQTTPQEQG